MEQYDSGPDGHYGCKKFPAIRLRAIRRVLYIGK